MSPRPNPNPRAGGGSVVFDMPGDPFGCRSKDTDKLVSAS